MVTFKISVLLLVKMNTVILYGTPSYVIILYRSY